jgi:signal transduction histidine kinase
MDDILKILVIDDDEVDRMAVRRSLTKAGFRLEVAEVENCTEAIAVLQASPFDCVFLDYRLPDQDGLLLVQQVRQLGIRVPLVVLTGQGDEEIAVDLMKAGATDYLVKSRVSPDNLARVLRNAIRVYQAELEAALANQRLRESNELLIRKNQELEIQRQQIQIQNIKLIEASRLKSQFLATMSHELRTPLNAIIGFSQLLLRPGKAALPPQQQDMVSRILNNGKNLLFLLNEILDFSKAEAGHLDLKPDMVDLAAVVQATVNELRSLAEQKQLALTVQIQLERSQVYNDANRLRQVLVNLVSNAIKFTDVGEVSVRVFEADDETIILQVQDTGIGIAPEHFSHIFEAFRQVDQTNTRKHAGTGLGLAITDSLVCLMEGTIQVDSTIGDGSTFTVRLPRRVSNPHRAADCTVSLAGLRS